MNEDKAARYHRLGRRAAASILLLHAAVLVALPASGLAVRLRDVSAFLAGSAPVSAATMAVFVLLLALALEIVTLPAALYRSFILDRRYGLSSVPLRTWLLDHGKGFAVSLVVGLAAAEIVYLTLSRWGGAGWAASAVVFIVAMLLMARVAPALLLPIFYRFKPLDRPGLRSRLESLSARAGLPVLGVYEWGLGEKTKRANAALVGTGRGRRVLLSDTLLASYTDDEIEVILAHELGHHAHRDIRNGLAVEALLIAATCAIASQALAVVAAPLGLRGNADPAGLPVVLIVAGAISLLATPAMNAWSRRTEHRADRFALRLTERPDAFESAMRRLAAQNLAEERPSAATLWLFHTHPPFDERIRAARSSLS